MRRISVPAEVLPSTSVPRALCSLSVVLSIASGSEDVRAAGEPSGASGAPAASGEAVADPVPEGGRPVAASAAAPASSPADLSHEAGALKDALENDTKLKKSLDEDRDVRQENLELRDRIVEMREEARAARTHAERLEALAGALENTIKAFATAKGRIERLHAAVTGIAAKLKANALLPEGAFPKIYASLATVQTRDLHLSEVYDQVSDVMKTTTRSNLDRAANAQEQLDDAANAVAVSLEDYTLVYRDAIDEFVATLAAPNALVVSGGVSLGSYQAGFLHYTTQVLLRYRGLFEEAVAASGTNARVYPGFRILTGASAGSINAFIAALASCREPVVDPEESLFFQAWVPVGMRGDGDAPGLNNLDDVQTTAMLSRRPIQRVLDRIYDVLTKDEGWSSEPCDAILGLAATRLRARKIAVKHRGGSGSTGGRPLLHANRQTEKFLLRVTNGEQGGRPKFYPFLPPSDAEGRVLSELYPILGAGTASDSIDEKTVATLLLASSAVPLAFEPVPLHYQTRVPGKDPVPHDELFIDGGVFDNSPIGLATTLYGWTDHPGAGAPTYMFIEPDAVAWTPGVEPGATADVDARIKQLWEEHLNLFGNASAERQAEIIENIKKASDGLVSTEGATREPGTLLEKYLPFLQDFMTTATETELLAAIEATPSFQKTDPPHDQPRLDVPPRLLPAASAHFANFLGFYERDFRVFDFYLGMASAAHYLGQRSSQFRALQDSPSLNPNPMTFDCIDAFRRATSDFAHLSQDPGEVLECRSVDTNLVALLRAASEQRKWVESTSYGAGSETDHFIAAVANAGFRFREIPCDGVESDDVAQCVRRYIRDDLQHLIQALGKRQPGCFAPTAVYAVGKAAANYLEYRPPHWFFGYLGAQTDRGAEAGGGFGFGYTGLKLQAGLRVFRWDISRIRATRHTHYRIDFEPYARLTYELPLAAIPSCFSEATECQLRPHRVVQLELGAGANVKNITHVGCPAPGDWYTIARRWGPEFSLTFTVYQRAYLDIAFTRYRDDCAHEEWCREIRVAKTPSSVAPIAHKGEVLVSLGWRFIE